jgi:rRNA maturation RNase YbeY
MIKVNVKKQTNYPISAPKIKKALQAFFEAQGIVSDAEVSVAIVGQVKMFEIAKKYLKEKGKKLHNVLSFTPDEAKGFFVYPPDELIHLGEIILCYPAVLEQAKREGKLIDEVAKELIEHSALHLMGVHHT